MRLTRRGEYALISLAILAGFGAGLTAQAWDPWAHADTAQAQK